MSAMQRAKGQAGERELAAEIHAVTGWAVKRRVRQHAGDSDLEGVPGWAVECKRQAKATRGDIAAWWAQTVQQADRTGDMPVLFYRLDRSEWRAVWPLTPASWAGLPWRGTCCATIRARLQIAHPRQCWRIGRKYHFERVSYARAHRMARGFSCCLKSRRWLWCRSSCARKSVHLLTIRKPWTTAF
jgi:Holliday junction resolvase